MLRVMQVRVLPTFETVRRVGLPFIDVFFKSVQQKSEIKTTTGPPRMRNVLSSKNTLL